MTGDPVTEAEALAWLDGYKRAWEERDPAILDRLFVPEVTYFENPYHLRFDSLDEVKRYWVNRVQEGQRDIDFNYELWSVDTRFAAAHWTVQFLWLPMNAMMELDGVFRLEFADPDGSDLRRVRLFREWFSHREG